MLPTRIGSSARSIPRKLRFTGTAVSRNGSQPYSFPERPARFSGVNGSTPLMAQNRPMKMGICITSGPRQPTGFTPISL